MAKDQTGIIATSMRYIIRQKESLKFDDQGAFRKYCRKKLRL